MGGGEVVESSTLGKPYEIKPRCYWEHIGGTNLGTLWELGNPLRNLGT